MIRVANTGDLHLTDGPRFDDTFGCLNFVADDANAQGAQLFLIGGDLVGTQVPHRASIRERNHLAALFQKMASVAPVVIVSGNHCSPGDIAIYGELRGAHPIIAAETPQIVELPGVAVFAWPFAWKRDWLARASGGSEEKDRQVEAAIRDAILAWRPAVEAFHARGIPCVFVGHGALRGAAIAGGEVMPPGTEIELVAEELLQLGCDYYGISHIHLAQQVRDGIWLPGSPSRSTFGEQDVKGYNLVDVEAGRPPIVHRRLTPARRFVTVEATWSLDAGDGTPGWQWEKPDVDGAEVRVRVTVPEEAAATAPVDDLAAVLFEAGAVDVKSERRTVPKQELRCAAIVEAESLEAQVRAWWSTLGDAGPDEAQTARCLEKLSILQRGEQFTLGVAA